MRVSEDEFVSIKPDLIKLIREDYFAFVRKLKARFLAKTLYLLKQPKYKEAFVNVNLNSSEDAELVVSDESFNWQ